MYIPCRRCAIRIDEVMTPHDNSNSYIGKAMPCLILWFYLLPTFSMLPIYSYSTPSILFSSPTMLHLLAPLLAHFTFSPIPSTPHTEAEGADVELQTLDSEGRIPPPHPLPRARAPLRRNIQVPIRHLLASHHYCPGFRNKVVAVTLGVGLKLTHTPSLDDIPNSSIEHLNPHISDCGVNMYRAGMEICDVM